MMESLGLVTSPETELKRIHELPEDGSVSLSFMHEQYYLEDTPTITLHCTLSKEDGHTWCVVSDDPSILQTMGEGISTVSGAIDLSRPLRLSPVRIPKPWGAEIWYTGIEQRGVSSINGTPLPWILELAGNLGCGTEPPLLLKILDPLPNEALGDLYFELHEEKVEVYVVTSIDPAAWPNGTGYIRYGFAPTKLAAYESHEAFGQDYLQNVRAYQDVRRQIDDTFDEYRSEAGIPPRDVLDPATVDAWRTRLPAELLAEEKACLEAMNSFTTLEPLSVGDIVRVTPFTPHSLQHGVRVVEFQTPHYERHILSFGQKVLTQDHWDTEVAMEKVDWDARFDKRVEQITSTDAFTADRVADFDEFRVLRLTIRENGSFVQDLDTYAVIIGVEGSATVNAQPCGKEEALLVPRLAGRLEIASQEGCCLLLAFP